MNIEDNRGHRDRSVNFYLVRYVTYVMDPTLLLWLSILRTCAVGHLDATAQMIAVKKESPQVTLYRPTKSVFPPWELSLLDHVRMGEVHYEANTSTIGWKEADVCWHNNWLFLILWWKYLFRNVLRQFGIATSLLGVVSCGRRMQRRKRIANYRKPLRRKISKAFL